MRPPLQQNCVDEEEGEIIEPEENHINLIGYDNEEDVFLTEEEQGFFSSDQTDTNYEDFEDYHLGFENAIMEIHNQYDLRRKKYLDSAKKDQIDTAIQKLPEITSKKTIENVNTMVKKAEQTKEKSANQTKTLVVLVPSPVTLRKPF